MTATMAVENGEEMKRWAQGRSKEARANRDGVLHLSRPAGESDGSESGRRIRYRSRIRTRYNSGSLDFPASSAAAWWRWRRRWAQRWFRQSPFLDRNGIRVLELSLLVRSDGIRLQQRRLSGDGRKPPHFNSTSPSLAAFHRGIPIAAHLHENIGHQATLISPASISVEFLLFFSIKYTERGGREGESFWCGAVFLVQLVAGSSVELPGMPVAEVWARVVASWVGLLGFLLSRRCQVGEC